MVIKYCISKSSKESDREGVELIKNDVDSGKLIRLEVNEWVVMLASGPCMLKGAVTIVVH